MFTVTAISTAVTSLLFFISGAHIYRSYKKTKNALTFFFGFFLLAFSAQQFLFFLASGPFHNNHLASVYLWALAHVFMFLGITVFLRFPLRIRFPHLEVLILSISMLYSVIASLILFYLSPDISTTLLENNIFIFEVLPIMGALIGVFTSLCLLFSVYVFISEYRTADEMGKMKFLFFSLGLVFFLVGGPIHNFVYTPFMLVFADWMIISGGFFFLLGVQSKSIMEFINKTT